MNVAQQRTHDFLTLCHTEHLPVRMRGGFSALVSPVEGMPLRFSLKASGRVFVLGEIDRLGALRDALNWRVRVL